MWTGWVVDTFKRIQNAIENASRTMTGLVF
jgi:hypothetical protein